MRLVPSLLFFLFPLVLLGQSSTSSFYPFTPYAPTSNLVSFRLGEGTISIREDRYGELNDLVFVHLHGLERSSLEAAQELLPLIGGRLIKIENKDQRNLTVRYRKRKWSIDPNRIFDRSGVQMNLREINRHHAPEPVVNQIERFGKQLISLLPDSISCIIALHNNFDGGFGINEYLPGGKRVKDARRVFVNPEEDPDDIVLTTDSLLYEHMAEACYNVIWQDAEQVKKDGSLSVYAAQKQLRYVNIETEHDKKDHYQRMLQHLMIYLIREKVAIRSEVNPSDTSE